MEPEAHRDHALTLAGPKPRDGPMAVTEEQRVEVMLVAVTFGALEWSQGSAIC
jgi:hypothetical protein